MTVGSVKLKQIKHPNKHQKSLGKNVDRPIWKSTKVPKPSCATSARMNRRTAQWWSSISNKTWQFNENPYATSWCRCPKSCVYGWQTSNVLSWYGDNGSSDSTSYDICMYIKINEYKKQTLCCIKKYIYKWNSTKCSIIWSCFLSVSLFLYRHVACMLATGWTAIPLAVIKDFSMHTWTCLRQVGRRNLATWWQIGENQIRKYEQTCACQ